MGVGVCGCGCVVCVCMCGCVYLCVCVCAYVCLFPIRVAHCSSAVISRPKAVSTMSSAYTRMHGEEHGNILYESLAPLSTELPSAQKEQAEEPLLQ